MERNEKRHISICSQVHDLPKVKFDRQKSSGMLQTLEIPEWKWESVSMDFVVGLPKTKRGNDTIWVIVDRLTKTSRFIAMRKTGSIVQMAEVHIKEVIRLHGSPKKKIVPDRDPRYLSNFWRELQEAFGTKLKLSTAFHPATDGQTERTIQTLEDMLRACALKFKGSWEETLSLIEFSYNNSHQTTIGMSPYEALYGRRCRMPIC